MGRSTGCLLPVQIQKQRADPCRGLVGVQEKPQLAGDEPVVAGACPLPKGGSL